MGGGIYSTADYSAAVLSRGYDTKSVAEIFTQREINNAMNPYGIKFRESRDSDEHPNSLAVILALDVTGSMGSIPHHLVKEGFPTMMDGIIQRGIADPQVLFMGIGDHECDKSPFQVGQFESSDELLMKWLTDVYLEGGGGGNYGESYALAWYFAGYHTQIDCHEKRSQKGFLFTIGDEPVLKDTPKVFMENLMGEGQYENFTSVQLLDKAKEKYNVYHIHVKQGSNGERQEVMDGWKQLIGDNLIIVDDFKDIPKILAELVVKGTSGVTKAKVKLEETGTFPEEEML